MNTVIDTLKPHLIYQHGPSLNERIVSLFMFATIFTGITWLFTYAITFFFGKMTDNLLPFNFLTLFCVWLFFLGLSMLWSYQKEHTLQARAFLERPVLLIDRQGLIFAPQCPQKALRLFWSDVERLELPKTASSIHLLLKEEWILVHKDQLLDQNFTNGFAQDVYHEIHDNYLILDHDHNYSVDSEELFKILTAYQKAG